MLTDDEIIVAVKWRLGAESASLEDNLALNYLDEAKSIILNYINRRVIPEGLSALLPGFTADLIRAKGGAARTVAEEKQGERTIRYADATDALLSGYTAALNRYRVIRTQKGRR